MRVAGPRVVTMWVSELGKTQLMWQSLRSRLAQRPVHGAGQGVRVAKGVGGLGGEHARLPPGGEGGEGRGLLMQWMLWQAALQACSRTWVRR